MKKDEHHLKVGSLYKTIKEVYGITETSFLEKKRPKARDRIKIEKEQIFVFIETINTGITTYSKIQHQKESYIIPNAYILQDRVVEYD